MMLPPPEGMEGEMLPPQGDVDEMMPPPEDIGEAPEMTMRILKTVKQ